MVREDDPKVRCRPKPTSSVVARLGFWFWHLLQFDRRSQLTFPHTVHVQSPCLNSPAGPRKSFWSFFGSGLPPPPAGGIGVPRPMLASSSAIPSMATPPPPRPLPLPLPLPPPPPPPPAAGVAAAAGSYGASPSDILLVLVLTVPSRRMYVCLRLWVVQLLIAWNSDVKDRKPLEHLAYGVTVVHLQHRPCSSVHRAHRAAGGNSKSGFRILALCVFWTLRTLWKSGNLDKSKIPQRESECGCIRGGLYVRQGCVSLQGRTICGVCRAPAIGVCAFGSLCPENNKMDTAPFLSLAIQPVVRHVLQFFWFDICGVDSSPDVESGLEQPYHSESLSSARRT